MDKLTIRAVKLRENAVMPAFATPGSAGADLTACIDGKIVVDPGKTVMVPTGIAMEIPEGYAGFVFARSGLATRSGLAPANKVGVIDSDYRGEILVSLHNHGEDAAEIAPGQRIAQLVIMSVYQAEFVQTQDLSETDRGAGGFGSTGR